MKRPLLIFLFLLTAFALRSNAQGLVINEVDYDQFQPSSDSAEFIELYNGGSSAVDLSNYAMVLVNGNAGGAAPYSYISFPAYTLNPGAFYVICGNGGFVANCNQQQPVYTNMIQNGSPDAMALLHLPDSGIVDALSYEGTVPGYSNGVGVPLSQSDTVIAPYISIGRYPDGTNTGSDSADFNRMCITPGAANVNSATSCTAGVQTVVANTHLVIFPNPASDVASLIGLPATRSDWEVVITDITGKVTFDRSMKSVNHSIQLDLSAFENGVYVVNARNSEQPAFKGKMKLVVQH